ncbi:hypothetical protein CNMCM6106_001572 [Aspergillus hiratsukae]|uniref:Cytochrome P450 n=1 Tax=Aspergillus hiratsukae TaxID=1194566 RepID=A0A8H6Q460_9EURO|nr:hypothetical protein CNMCM6106_001572 [Aspergillus hiratsukae]
MAVIVLLAVAAVALLVGYPIAEYFVDAKNLRRFPAPSVAGLTDLWALRYHWTNTRYKAIHQAHARLGPIVRIQPHHISFTDPRALRDIYGHGSPIMKSNYYDNVAGEYHDVANATDRADHSRKRRFMSHIFSQKQVLNMEEVINVNLANFVKAMDQRLGQDIDIRYWFNLFTYDAISSLSFGHSFDFLGQGNDQTLAQNPDGSTYPIRVVKTFHDAVTYASFMGHARPGLSRFIRFFFSAIRSSSVKASKDFGAMCLYRATQRIQSGKGDRADFLSKLQEPPKAGIEPMPFGELVAETGILLNAGNDTTASGLTNTLWLLAKHPHTLDKLRAELDTLMDRDMIQPDFNMLMAAPYLRACIDESLRLRPPVAIGLPRVTPPEGSTICGEFIPGGVTVSAPILELHRHPSLFSNPDVYNPERWFDEKELPNLREYVQPFSIGGRACIGRNLAMIELTKVIATVVNRYEVELCNKEEELGMIERFNMNPADCYVRLTPRAR